MNQLFAFSVSDPERLRCALFPHRALLRVESEKTRDGWGLGFYQGDEVLLRKQPLAHDGTLDFYELSKTLKTDMLMGHVREATIGGRDAENTHPFRFRRWMGAHIGTIQPFSDIRQELLASIPDFLSRNIRGQTDSEHLFHLVLAFLHDGGRLDDLRVSPDTIGDAIRTGVALVDRAVAAHALAGAVGEPPLVTLAVTNGRSLAVLRRGQPLYVLRRNGVLDCGVCREYNRMLGRGDRPVPHEHLRSVLLLSSSEAKLEAGAEEVPDHSLALVDRALNVSVKPLPSARSS